MPYRRVSRLLGFRRASTRREEDEEVEKEEKEKQQRKKAETFRHGQQETRESLEDEGLMDRDFSLLRSTGECSGDDIGKLLDRAFRGRVISRRSL